VRARLLDVGDGDGDIAKAPRFGVSRVVWRVFQRLRSVTVGKFEDAYKAQGVATSLMDV